MPDMQAGKQAGRQADRQADRIHCVINVWIKFQFNPLQPSDRPFRLVSLTSCLSLLLLVKKGKRRGENKNKKKKKTQWYNGHYA